MAPTPPQLDDHDLLVEIHTIVRRLDHDINGNGRPGLNDRVTALETLSVRMDAVEARQPSSKQQKGALVSALAALLLALAGLVTART